MPERVVVTGIGAVTTFGMGVDALWDGLLAGRSGVGPIESFDASGLPVRIAAEVRGFDPADWLARKDVTRLDRFCQFGLVAADLAVADACLSGVDRERAATVVGSAIGGAATMVEGVLTGVERPHMVSPFFVPGSIVNMASAAVAQRHGFTGPSGAPVTACASSADAVGQGYRLVRDGYASACLAGGTEACLVASVVAGFANMRALSRRNGQPHQASRPFDAERDGFVLGEGAAMLLLEPARSARARGARIYAEICGYGQTNDAYHMTSPDPTGQAAARAMREAVREAGLRPADVDHVNAHATSTRFADAAETAAIKRAFGTHARQLAVSATKSMTGHLLGAAGAVEAAVCALTIHHGWLPPTVNYQTPDPDCDLDYVPNVARRQEVAVALSNSFAFGGHNVSLALRRFP